MGNDNKQWCVVAFCDQWGNTLRASPTLPETWWYVHFWSLWSREWDLVPSFVELHCGTYRILSPFLLPITRLLRELNPNSPPKRFLCSNSMENCFKGETTVVTWKSWGKWHLQLLTRCYCILKSNRGTVYAPINIPSNPPPSPQRKKSNKCIINDMFTN